MQNDSNEGEFAVRDDPIGKLEALHDEEYRIQQVLADLVDNSIDANSSLISIEFDECDYDEKKKQYPFLNGEGYFILINDNGDGVSEDRIFKALSRGHRRDYDEWELGHFGVGLKDSSFSQAYEITLFSKHKSDPNQIRIVRYSSCAVKNRIRDIHLTPEGMVGDFSWMKETEGYQRALEHLKNVNHGTSILLEGLHKIQGQSGRDDEASIVYVNEVKNSCENYLRLAFEHYIREEGFNVPLSEPNPDDGLMHKHKFVQIEFNDEILTPLDPFCRTMTDEATNYGTLTWTGKIRTPVADTNGVKKPRDVKITIYLIPNKKHPNFIEHTEEIEADLQSALGVGAYFLQGFFFYRNGRLLDAAGKQPWKGVYKDIDNQKTHIRWEIHLPPGRSVGKAEVSEFRITKSKGSVGIEPRIRKELSKIASSKAKQIWHHLDPDYPMGMGDRGRIRLNKDSGEKSNKERFKACTICGDYRHKKAKHICSVCGKSGHELDCLPKCKACGLRGHTLSEHTCSKCGELGHEKSCIELTDENPDTDHDSNNSESVNLESVENPGLNKVVVNKVESGLPLTISLSEEESTLKIDFNQNHPLFEEILEKIRSITPDRDA